MPASPLTRNSRPFPATASSRPAAEGAHSRSRPRGVAFARRPSRLTWTAPDGFSVGLRICASDGTSLGHDEVERGILGEDLSLEFVEGSAGLDAELVDECAAALWYAASASACRPER